MIFNKLLKIQSGLCQSFNKTLLIMRINNPFLIAIALLVFSCSQEISHPGYSGEADPEVIRDFNRTVAQSETGFSKSYRASQASARQIVPEFYEAQQIFRKYGKEQWLTMSAELKPYLSQLSSQERLMETQLLALMMVDKYLLPIRTFSDQAQQQQYVMELTFYLDLLVENHAIDLDVLTNTVLQLRQYRQDDNIKKATNYIVTMAKQDWQQAKEKLSSLNPEEEKSFYEVSKRHFEQVLAEAEYAVYMLKDLR